MKLGRKNIQTFLVLINAKKKTICKKTGCYKFIRTWHLEAHWGLVYVIWCPHKLFTRFPLKNTRLYKANISTAATLSSLASSCFIISGLSRHASSNLISSCQSQLWIEWRRTESNLVCTLLLLSCTATSEAHAFNGVAQLNCTEKKACSTSWTLFQEQQQSNPKVDMDAQTCMLVIRELLSASCSLRSSTSCLEGSCMISSWKDIQAIECWGGGRILEPLLFCRNAPVMGQGFGGNHQFLR